MKIAVVGNGEKTDYNGAFIDNCDIVFRFNRAVTSNYEPFIGNKTTHMGMVNEGNIAINHTLQKVDRRVIKKANEVWFPRPKTNKDYEKKIKTICQKDFKFVYCTQKTYDYLYKQLKCEQYKDYACQPSTGISIIQMIIENIKFDNMFVFGFDGFKTVHYWEQRERKEQLKYHNGNAEIEFLKYLSLSYNIEIV